MAPPTRVQMFQAAVQTFLWLLGSDAPDEMMGRWLDPDLETPMRGLAAWSRSRLGLTMGECEQLANDWPQQLDYVRSGVLPDGIYAVALGPRGPIRILLREADGRTCVVPAGKLPPHMGELPGPPTEG